MAAWRTLKSRRRVCLVLALADNPARPCLSAIWTKADKGKIFGCGGLSADEPTRISPLNLGPM